MEQVSTVLYWFAFALYVGATVLYAYQFILRRQKVAWWARFLTGAGFLCQTLSIGANSMARHGTPLDGANQLVLASWALVLLYFVMEHVMKIRAYGAFLVPVAAVLMVVAQFMGEGTGGLRPGDPYYGNITAIHVALVVFANAGFAVGSVSSALYLFQNRQLKRHKTNVVSRRLPSLATLQLVARRAISLSFPVYTAGLTMGMVRAVQADLAGWWQDPRIMMSGIVWFTFGAYLVALYRHNVSSRTLSWLAVVGFVFVSVLAVLARTLPLGFHVFGLR